RTIELEPGKREELAFDLPRDAPTIDVKLASDALAIDDVAYLAPRPPRTVAIHSELSDERARELFLVGRDGSRIGRWLELVDETIEIASADTAHILLSESAGGGPTTWSLVVASGGTARGASEHKDFIGPFLIERRHPLLEGITLEGIVWSADPAPS